MKLWQNGNFRIGAVLACVTGALIISGFFYLPYDYNAMNGELRFSRPGLSHPMGTDNFGRDVFCRVISGGKYTLLTAMFTVVLSAAIGSALGMFSGFKGGFPDEVLMRLMDALNSFPTLIIALVMVSLLGNSHRTLIAALVIMFIPSFTRIMRSGALQYKTRDFVLAARIQGAGSGRIIFVHILPSLFQSLLSAAVLGLSNATLAESTMSYLGMGIQPPTPSWGRMLAESQNFLFNAPWCALFPGSMIMLTVLAFHFLGEGLRQGGE